MSRVPPGPASVSQRGPQPSVQMLTALSRGLRLSQDERDHLFRLAGQGTPNRVRHPQHVPPGIMRVPDRLSDTPAKAVDDLGVTIVQNRLAVALPGDQTVHQGPARSAVVRWFLADPAERGLRAEDEHAEQSRVWAADLRAAVGHGTAGAAELVELRLVQSREFAEVWARHEVAVHTGQRKSLRHPQVGEIQVDCQVLHSEDRSQRLSRPDPRWTPDEYRAELRSVLHDRNRMAQRERRADDRCLTPTPGPGTGRAVGCPG